MTFAVTRAAALAVAVFVLTGCVRFTSVNTFSADDTVTQDLIVAIAPDAAAQLDIDPNELTATALTGPDATSLDIDPNKLTIEDYVEEDLHGIHVVATELTLDEFNIAFESGIGDVAPDLSMPMTVTRDGDDYVITIPADASRDLSGVQGADAIGLIAGSINVAITFNFPGPVKSTTAGSANGKTVVLGVEDLLTPDEIVIRGGATDAIAWAPVLRWAGIIAVAVIIFGGAALLIWQDKRRQARTPLPPPVSTGEGPPSEPVSGGTSAP